MIDFWIPQFFKKINAVVYKFFAVSGIPFDSIK
jgi:hypothetical protein